MIEVLRRSTTCASSPSRRERFLDRLRRRGGFDDAVVAAAGTRTSGARSRSRAGSRGHILEFLGDRLADARLRVATRADLVRVRHIDLDALARQLRRQGPAPRRADGASAAGRAARPNPFRSARPPHRLVGQLRKGQPQLIGTDPFGFLPEETLTEDVELMAQRRISRCVRVSSSCSVAISACAVARSATSGASDIAASYAAPITYKPTHATRSYQRRRRVCAMSDARRAGAADRRCAFRPARAAGSVGHAKVPCSSRL